MSRRERKFYVAVRHARTGPRVYVTCEPATFVTSKFPGAVQRIFVTEREAWEWVAAGPFVTFRQSEGRISTDNIQGVAPASPSQDPPVVELETDIQGKPSVKLEPGVKLEQDEPSVKFKPSIKSESGIEHEAEVKRETSVKHEPDVKLEPGIISEPDSEAEAEAKADSISPIPQDPPVVLSSEQEAVLFKVQNRENVFFTGPAGTGKSVVLRKIMAYYRATYTEPEHLAVTAATGIASINIGGSTIYSWAGIGLGKEPKEQLLGKLLGIDKRMRLAAEFAKQNGQDRPQSRAEIVEDMLNSAIGGDDEQAPRPMLVERWRKVKTLIIDEISMIDGKLFDKLEYIARRLRRDPRPFGGIQLVVSGDFCQLPPVPDQEKGVQIPSAFAFEAESWLRCMGRPVMLTQVFRQRDQAFVDMLNSVRYGRPSPEAISTFRSLSRPVTYTDGIEPTDLFPTRREVDSTNTIRLKRLTSRCVTFKAEDHPGTDHEGKPLPKQQVDRVLKRLVAPEVLHLKVGAQVMLIKNIVQGLLVNGSLGRVTGFRSTRDALKEHIPSTCLDERGPLEEDSEGESDRKPLGERRRHFLDSAREWPEVQFDRGVSMLCVPADFEVIDAAGRPEAVRRQVPLILAWALSIHKSQGQTLERVRVDLDEVFERGQAYVALSRATNMQTLQVLHFHPINVKAHPRVLDWMAKNVPRQDDKTC